MRHRADIYGDENNAYRDTIVSLIDITFYNNIILKSIEYFIIYLCI